MTSFGKFEKKKRKGRRKRVNKGTQNGGKKVTYEREDEKRQEYARKGVEGLARLWRWGNKENKKRM